MFVPRPSLYLFCLFVVSLLLKNSYIFIVLAYKTKYTALVWFVLQHYGYFPP